MKDFFKKHPELLILIVVVIIVDCVIMLMWMDDTSATEKSRKEIETLRGQAKSINDSPYSITESNANKAKDESEKWAKALDDAYLAKAKNYVLETGYIKGMHGASAKKLVQNKINGLIDDGLVEKNKTADRLSFGVYDSNELISMSDDNRKIVFEILAATERLVNICIDADVISIDSIERPNLLKYAVDSSLGLKSYKFILKTTNTAEGVKRLMNQIASDEKFYFEVNGFQLKAEEQLNATPDDIRPKIEREAQDKQADKKSDDILDLGEELDRLGPKKDSGEAKLQEESVAPFVDAKVRLELTIDWIQYTKELKK